MKLWNAIVREITRDVSNENETKQTALIVRISALIMCLYFVCQGIVFHVCEYYSLMFVCGIWMLAYVASFYLTFHVGRAFIAFYFQAVTALWIAMYVYLIGWNVGAVQFLIVQVVFETLTNYGGKLYKIGFAATFCLYRMLLFLYTQYHTPIIDFSSGPILVCQTLNTVTIYVLIVVIVLVFGQNELEMEKKLRAYNERIKSLASKDPLTGLVNRRGTQEILKKQTERAVTGETTFTVVIADIDFFKRINDTYGHEAGDKVLVELSNVFLVYMEGKGYASRWGGEEFLLIFKGKNGDETMELLCKLQAHLRRRTYQLGEAEVSVTMTFGVEEYTPGKPLEYTINQADQKLYMGKNRGRDQIVY